VAWRDALQVAPLSGDDPKRLFLAIAGAKHRKDRHLSRLLVALDGMPLAIELMAHAAEAEPDLEGVWRRWNEQRTELLKRGKGDQRLLSLAVSLELSIASPRMTDTARRLLAMLSLLPSGVARGDVDALVPGFGHAAGATLRQAALAFDEAGRLRCLAPIREYISNVHPPSSGDFNTLLDYHYDRLCLFDKELDKLKISINEVTDRNDNAIETELLRVNGTMIKLIEDTERLMLHGISVGRPDITPNEKANYLIFLARMSITLAERGHIETRYDDAQEYADKALALYREVGDARGEADCTDELNRIAKARCEISGRAHAER
jgi:hypothetical protein